MLAELFGLPEADRERFGPWVQTLTRLQNEGFDANALVGDTSGDPDAQAGVRVIGEMFEYFTAAITAARQDPGDDLLGRLVTAEIDGERLSDWDILGFCFVVTAGGADTTASLISHTVLLTGQQMDQRELLLADPALIPDALVECLRYESSVQGLARTTLADVEVDGVEIPAGEKVLMLYGSANRDPREYGETADRLDVRREIGRHLAFSSGPHFCIGSHLARLQARVAVEELFAAHPHVTVDTEAGVRHQSAVRARVGLAPGGGCSALLVEEGRHRLAGLVGTEQAGAERRHLVGLASMLASIGAASSALVSRRPCGWPLAARRRPGHGVVELSPGQRAGDEAHLRRLGGVEGAAGEEGLRGTRLVSRGRTVSEITAGVSASRISVKAKVTSSLHSTTSLAATMPSPPARTGPASRVTTGGRG